MHFLLVNDDGIGAVGIMALLEAAVQRGHTVTMAAPATQQSAASHRITLTDPIFMQPYETNLPGVEAFAIRGTPADCVRIALRGGLMRQKPDVVISTGALAAIPFCLIAKVLFRRKLIYIESFARITSGNLTGKLLYRFADRFYVQWESMLKVYPKAICLGGIY